MCSGLSSNNLGIDTQGMENIIFLFALKCFSEVYSSKAFFLSDAFSLYFILEIFCSFKRISSLNANPLMKLFRSMLDIKTDYVIDLAVFVTFSLSFRNRNRF